MPKSNRVRAHPKAALRPAVASGCCRRAPPPPISSAKQESGGGLAVGQHRRPGRPGIRRAPFGARTPTIKSPITQPEMPERTHATDPLGQRFRSGRAAADPIAARRRRRIESAGRGAALACARKRPSEAERGPLSDENSRSGRDRPMPKSNRVRAHPKAALQPAVASGCCRRAPPPPISSAKQESGGGLAVGQHRRPGRPGIRRAPFGARTPTDQEPDHPA